MFQKEHSDNFINTEIDNHLHYGEGNYDLAKIINTFIPQTSLITMETGKSCPPADIIAKDAQYIRNIENKNRRGNKESGKFFSSDATFFRYFKRPFRDSKNIGDLRKRFLKILKK